MTETVSATQFPREYLDVFWGVSNEDPARRSTAVKDLLNHLNNAQTNQKTPNGASHQETPHLTYALKRLLKGLSGTENGRLGCSAALSEVLSTFKFLNIGEIHEKLLEESDHTKKDLTVQEKRSRCFGRIAGYLSIHRAERLSELMQTDKSILETCINQLLALSKDNSNLKEPSYEVICLMIASASRDQVKSVIPSLSKMISLMPEVSADNLALALQLSNSTNKPLSEFIPSWKNPLKSKQTISNIFTVFKTTISMWPKEHFLANVLLKSLSPMTSETLQLVNQFMLVPLYQSTSKTPLLGFSLLVKILTHISNSGDTEIIINKDLIQALIKCSNKEILNSTVHAIVQYAGPHISADLLRLFITLKFEDKCKAKIVAQLAKVAKVAEVQKLVKVMEKEILESRDLKETRYLLEKLYYIMSHNSHTELSADYCKFLVFLSFFRVTSSKKKVEWEVNSEISDEIREKCCSQLFSFLVHVNEKKVKYCHFVVDLFSYCENLVSKGFSTVIENVPDMSKSIKFIHGYKKKDDSSVEYWKESVIVLLVTSVIFGIYGQEIESDEGQDLLSDLEEIRVRIFKENKENSVEALTDLLVAMLTNPLSYFRTVVHNVFEAFTPDMTYKSLEILMAVIKKQKNNKKKGENEEEEEEEEEPAFDDSDVEEEEEEEENEDVDTETMEVEEEKEEDIVEPELDETMEEYDQQLADMFAAYQQGQKDAKEKKKAVVTFKMKVVELIEAYMSHTKSNLVYNLLVPLISALKTVPQSEIKTVGARLRQCLLRFYKLKQHPEVDATAANDLQSVYTYLWKNFHSRRKKPLDTIVPAIFLLTKISTSLPPLQFFVMKQWDKFVDSYFNKDLTSKDKFFADFVSRFSSIVWQLKDSLVKNFLVTNRFLPKLHSLQFFALLIKECSKSNVKESKELFIKVVEFASGLLETSAKEVAHLHTLENNLVMLFKANKEISMSFVKNEKVTKLLAAITKLLTENATLNKAKTAQLHATLYKSLDLPVPELPKSTKQENKKRKAGEEKQEKVKGNKQKKQKKQKGEEKTEETEEKKEKKKAGKKNKAASQPAQEEAETTTPEKKKSKKAETTPVKAESTPEKKATPAKKAAVKAEAKAKTPEKTEAKATPVKAETKATPEKKTTPAKTPEKTTATPKKATPEKKTPEKKTPKSTPEKQTPKKQ